MFLFWKCNQWMPRVPICFVCSPRLAWCGCRALKSSQHSLCSLLIVDTPGFQNPRLAKRECSATFEDLCHNYTQERLHGLFYQRTFVQELERYKEVREQDLVVSPCLPLLLQCLYLPPKHYFIHCAFTDVSTLFARTPNHQSRCPAHLSPVSTSWTHAFGCSSALPIFGSSVESLTIDGHCVPTLLCHRLIFFFCPPSNLSLAGLEFTSQALSPSNTKSWTDKKYYTIFYWCSYCYSWVFNSGQGWH